MQRVRADVLRRQLGESAHDHVLSGNGLLLDTTSIDGLIASVGRRCEPRAELPPRLRVFPFTLPFVRRAVIKLYNFLFKEQRLMHGAMVSAMRELVAVNRELYRRIVLLEARLQRDERSSD